MRFFYNTKLKEYLPLLFLTFLFFLWLDRPFSTPDEARYIEIPREMVASNDWLTPRLNGLKYFEKPPLMYWMHAILILLFGIQEWIMRLVPAFFGWIGAMATYVFARYLFDRKIALWSAIILSTSILYMALSRLIILDMPVSIFMTLSIMSGYVALQTRKRVWFWISSTVLAAGVMTKGPVALIIPCLVLLMWMLINRVPLRPFYPFSSLVLFFVLVAPWHIWVSLKNPDFCHKYFYVEHVLRYTTMLHKRYQPIWFFIPVVLLGMLPWTIFTLKAWKWREPFRFLWIWIFVVFGFFSLSNSKLIPYILPIFPAFAILAATLVQTSKFRIHLLCAALCSSFLLYKFSSTIQKASMKPLVNYIKKNRQEGERVACFRGYHQDVPVYLQEKVMVIDYLGELEFGARAQNLKDWIRPSCRDLHKIWIISRKDRWIHSKEQGKVMMEICESSFFKNDDRDIYWLIYKK